MKLPSLRSALLLFFICSVSAFAGERPGGFRVIGPGGGGAMFNPTISPHDTNTVLISCDMTGSYITHDGGKSWRMFNLRGVVNFFAFDPKDPKTMYAHATGLWRSTDNGENWNLVYPNPASVKGVKMSSDHSDEDILADPDPLGNISAMAIDPGNSKILYAATGGRTKGPFGLYLSRDAGETWLKLNVLTGAALKVFVNQTSSEEQRSVVVAGLGFIRVWKSSGMKNIPIPAGKTITDISVGFTAQGNPVFYVISDELAASVSDDWGTNWRQVQFGK